MCRRFVHSLLFCAVSSMLGACAPGLIYTDITVPLTKNMDRAPVGVKLAEITTQHVRLPVPRARVGAEWSSRAIGEAAEKAGLKKVFYADLRTFSVLAGTWRKETVRVWGE